MVVALLGILKAGGAYVPLNPSYPRARLAELVEDAAPLLVVCDAAGSEALGDESIGQSRIFALEEALFAEGEDSVPESERDSNPKVAGLSSGNLAYVIYTSGSTGKPKGVQNEHLAVVNRLVWMQSAYRIDASDVIVQKTPYGFDVSVWEFFWTLLNGATLVLALPDGHKDPRYLIELICKRGVTTAHFVASMLSSFLATEGVEGCTSLRRLVTSGEVLAAGSVRSCHQKLPRARLYNLYGPTEAAIDVTAWPCPVDLVGGTVPIGRPIANARIYVLDGYGEPVPRGAVGEIHIGGAGVARGYLNRPELTSERFVADPYGAEPGARMYRTGDLARYLADGNLEFLGRCDQQVKVRGYRIELGEIEARLLEHPEVREAVVVAREGAEGDKRLVAYVTTRREGREEGGGAGSELVSLLRSHLGRQLPEYMVPSAFVRLEALPLTPNGKLDRKALPAPDGESVMKRRYEAPEGEIEETLARLWSELLGVERVGRQDHFFELGGHSLLAVRLLSRVREALQVEVPLTRLFGEPTLAGQGEAIGAILESRGVQALPAIGRVSREGPLLLSFAQQRLWFLAKLGASTTYHMPMGLRLRGRPDASALRKSLDRLVWRHESLRSVFVTEDGEPRVKLLPAESGFALVEEDLEHAPDAGERLERMSREEAETPFDLEQGPLLRGRLIRLGPEEHVLLLTQHHIVSDGWSMGVFTRELGALYEAFASGKADPLPALETQYPDYAAWQRAWLTGERLKAQAAYWRENLVGAPERLELPTDRPRPKEQSFAGGFVGLRLDRELTRGLKRVSQEQGATLLMTVLSAWSMVLSRLSGQEEVVIGVPTANRGRREVEGLIGFFVNTLALRIDVSGEPSVEELVSRVRKTALMAQEHQDLPFEQVVEIVSPPRRLDQSPVFQVMCAWEQGEGGGFALGGLKVEPAGAPPQTVKFDVELSLGEVDGGIVGGLGYATALFDSGTIERHGGYLEAALRALVADGGRRVGQVELLSPSERKLLLETWNETAASYPRERCIHELFEEQVGRAPEALALVQGEEELSYGELNRRANRLAHRLIEKGVEPGDCVATLLERGLWLVVAELGILKAGGVYVPLDPEAPALRRAWMVGDCGARLVVASRGDAVAREWVSAERNEPVLWVDESSEEGPAPTDLALRLSGKSAAYVMYTSGSTGTPKGVVVPHGAVVNLARSESARIVREDRIAYTANASFDASTFEVWSGLLNGASVVIVPRAVLLDARLLSGYVEEHRVSILQLVAGLLQTYAARLGEVFPRLRYLVTGGDVADARAFARVLQSGPEHLLQTYGPTETTTFATAWVVGEVAEDAASVAIGRPIANARIYVLDGYGEPVPLGAAGELYIGGAGVARGYLNRPELTSERFVADPYSPEAGARMYRTGDLARYLADGNLEFLGRRDQQVKVRGYRIELGEIEARLLEHPEVRDAVVVAREGVEGDKRLVAYVTTRREGREEGGGAGAELVSLLRSHLGRQLPEYMVPSAFVRLEEFPLTPNGKLDRKALPAPDGESVALRTYEAPQGEIEETLARLWSELLGVERVGRQDHFFELGGHSLLAVRLLSRVREALQVELPLTRLFGEPTLAGQGEAIEAILESRGVQALPAIGRVSREGPLVLSFGQQRLWFLAKLGASATYHIPMGLRLRGHLEASALRKSLDRLVWRHESLRSVFVTEEGEPRVKLLPAESGFALVEEDLEHAPDARERLERMSREEAEAPFDLEQGPLLRGRLIRLGPEEHVLLLTQHHIVSDGWSMGVFTRELGALYEAYASGKADPLPALDIQYPDYAAWQRAWLTGERLEAQAAYWRENLAGAPLRLELPTDRPRPKEQSFEGGFVGLRLDRELTRGLKRVSQEQGATLLMTVLSAWSMVLSRLSGQEEVVIGIPTANRGRREVEALIGFFVNTLALRIDVSGEPSVVELLLRVRKTALEAQEHQDLPFEQVVEIVSPPRRLDQSPVFQVMCTWEQGGGVDFALGGLKVEPAGVPYERVKFDVELSLGEMDGVIVGGLAYATALFDGGTIERHGGYLEAALRALVADGGRRVGQVELLSPSERKLLLETWNETARSYPRERCIHELFEEQVRRAPEAVALVQGEEEVTYGELNRRANRLAHRLIEKGVGLTFGWHCAGAEPVDGGGAPWHPEGGRSVRAARSELPESDGSRSW